MKIVLLCGNQPNQIALANKLAHKHKLTAIILENKKVAPVPIFQVKKITAKLLDVTVFSIVRSNWIRLMSFYSEKYSQLPVNIPVKSVTDVNSKEVQQFIIEHQPDLLLVSGTSLIRKNILEMQFPNGILNLHTGLSPYVKGGPNCTNWCLATKQAHLIGNTVMWIDAGIDSGDIVATELTELSGKESFFELHLKVMEHAHQLYIKCVDALQNKKTLRIKQADISKGKTYFTKMWDWKYKLLLMYNFLFYYKREIKNRKERIVQEKIIFYPISR